MSKLIIVDLVSNNYKDLYSVFEYSSTDIILALTPSSFYFLDSIDVEYITFHDIISQENFRDDILELNKEVLNCEDDEFKKAFYIEVSKKLNYYYYIENILQFIEKKQFSEVVYYSDRDEDSNNILSNTNSLLFKYINFAKIYKINRLNYNHIFDNSIRRKYSLKKMYLKVLKKIFRLNYEYDWEYIQPNVEIFKYTIDNSEIVFDVKSDKFKKTKLNNLSFKLNASSYEISDCLTFLSETNHIAAIIAKNNNISLNFFQHGSYLYKNIFLKNAEIEQAAKNFVFNDYTKKLFEEKGAKKVYTVGSLFLNQQIKDRKKEYDFLYITQGHDYVGNFQYVDFPNSSHSFDGHELYKKHIGIIDLFGKKFTDKKIVIRLHPGVVTVGVYVPLFEYSKKYKNITIDVYAQVHTLIEKSEYIISDYFSSEFINRELHYKRDIILFKGPPTPLPKDTITDMEKIFILVDTVEDLEEKVKNIENITKDRQRYDDIIEYYSSKKCDTKKVVTEILEKEFNART